MAYGVDLCERVMKDVDGGQLSQRAIALKYRVSRGFVQDLIERRATRGSLDPLEGGHRKQALQKHNEAIREAIKKQPDLRLIDLADRFRPANGKPVNKGTMSRHLQRLKLAYKKN